jgi:predicted RNA-binding protein with PIN domain
VTGVLLGDMEAARERFIHDISAYKKRKGHDITVVFDGWKDGGGREQRQVIGGIKVIFTALGEQADTVIKKTLTGDVEWIVISSDREIQQHAWAKGSVPIGSGEFLKVLERKSPEGEYSEDEDEEGTAHQQKKGNPKRPSRKQKAFERALRKL